MNVRCRLPLAVVAVALLASMQAVADDQPKPVEPVFVMSFSGLDNVLGDVEKLFAAVDAQPQFALIAELAKTNMAGIDRTRPWGAIVGMQGETTQRLAFVPVTDLQQVLAIPAVQAQLGEMEKLPGGVLHITHAQTKESMYVKQQGGWAFTADALDQLESLPDDPVALLGGLEKQYDVAFRVYVQRVPATVRERLTSPAPRPELPDVAEDQTGKGQTDSEQPGEEADPTRQVLEKMFADTFTQMRAAFLKGVFDHLDQATVGLTLDGEAMKSRIDVSATVLKESPLAPRLQALAGARSAHGGILAADAMMAIHYCIALLPEDARALATLLEAFGALGGPPELAPDADAEQRARAQREQEMQQLLMRSMTATVRSGKLDGGFAFMLKPGASAFVYCGTAGNADALEKLMAELTEAARSEFKLPDVEPQKQEYKGYQLRTITGLPVEAIETKRKSDDASGEELDLKKYIGETAELTTAVKGTDYYVAFGAGCVEKLRRIIDANERGAGQPAAPLTMAFAVRQFMQLPAGEGDHQMPQHVRERLERMAGPDRVLIQVTASGRSAALRIELEKLPLLATVLAALENPPFGRAAAAPLESPPGGGR